MKKIKLLLTVFALVALTVDSRAQNAWVQVSTTLDSYFRINKTENGNYLCSASTNDIYISENLTSWNATSISFPSQPHLAFNKDENNNLFIATAHNGLYQSTNNGVSWSYSNVGSGFGCGSLDVIGDELNTLYLGVGGSCRGLHVSSDNGLTWVNKIPGKDFTDLEVMNGLNLVYACNTNNEIFYSGDNGNNWQQILGQPFSNTAVMIKHLGDDLFVFCNNGDFYKTSNGGLTWSFLSNIPITGTAGDYANDLVFINPLTWFVGFNQNGIWKTSDGGISWTQSDTGIFGDFHYLFNEGSTILATTTEGIFLYEEIVGINAEPQKSNLISLYPNPASQVVTLDCPADFIGKNYFIYDALGRKVTQGVILSTKIDIDVQQFSAGDYILQCDSVMIKLIKQQ
jgi:photosystem II stability/assembly factor-like uncharacterized protein